MKIDKLKSTFFRLINSYQNTKYEIAIHQLHKLSYIHLATRFNQHFTSYLLQWLINLGGLLLNPLNVRPEIDVAGTLI